MAQNHCFEQDFSYKIPQCDAGELKNFSNGWKLALHYSDINFLKTSHFTQIVWMFPDLQ